MELKFVNVSKNYKNKCALADFSVTLGEGIHALLGSNGAGKSTLMNILTGLITSTSGEVLVDGKRTVKMGADFRKILGYMPQEPGFYPSFSGQDILKYYADLKGTPKAKDKIAELLALVNLTEDKRRRVGQYSGGMKRRLGIAVALLNDPKILVLDEPTAGLDPEERMRFRNIISQISFDKIVILATHIVSDIESISDDCLLLKSGRLVTVGTPDELKRSIDGKVWNIPCERGEAEQYVSRNACANIIKINGQSALHIVSDNPPAENAQPAAPDLEDVYVFYFNELSR